jgi:hypothetical protein
MANHEVLVQGRPSRQSGMFPKYSIAQQTLRTSAISTGIRLIVPEGIINGVI